MLNRVLRTWQVGCLFIVASLASPFLAFAACSQDGKSIHPLTAAMRADSIQSDITLLLGPSSGNGNHPGPNIFQPALMQFKAAAIAFASLNGKSKATPNPYCPHVGTGNGTCPSEYKRLREDLSELIGDPTNADPNSVPCLAFTYANTKMANLAPARDLALATFMLLGIIDPSGNGFVEYNYRAPRHTNPYWYHL
jgi:hypothetical protein